jgi:mannose-6-phosphate isomerase-like protein (cupin superfamily)
MVMPIRRVVAGNDNNGKAVVLSDGPSSDVHRDPARPGFASTRLWVQEETPARVKGRRETLHLPHTIEPPRNGSVCRVVEFPPEADHLRKISHNNVTAFFASMGSPGAAAGGPGAAHPYMQKTQTLDFCYIMEGEITLVLDTQEVHLREGDTVVQRGTRHAWSNRSNAPCIIVFSQHDGAF